MHLLHAHAYQHLGFTINFAQPALAMAYSDHSDFMRMLSDLTNDLSEIRLFDLKLQGQVRIQLGSYW